MGPKVKPILERLKAKTEYQDGGCWLWNGSKTHNGYGEIRTVDRRLIRVHRLSYEEHRGPIPAGVFVLHECDQRNCWNPNHLFLGTAAENTADMMGKHRHIPAPCPGEANGNALVTEDIVRLIRADSRRIIDIAADYGIHFTTVSDIKRRKTWKHVT
jgi:hypothetical protein